MPHNQENEIKARLAEVTGLTDVVSDRMLLLADQMGEVTTGDIEILADLAELDVRADGVRTALADPDISADPAVWLRFSAQLDRLAAQRRALLRELKVTRGGIEGPSRTELKMAGKSGASWDGIL